MSFFEPGRYRAGNPDEASEHLVTLTQEEAAAARQLLCKLVKDPGSEALQQPTTDSDVHAVARAIFQSRKRRVEHFGASLFSEPAWDMLLILFLYGDKGEQITVTKLASFNESPLTTAIRWLDYLECQRLIVRSQCAIDRRKLFVELSAKGRSSLTDYFTAVIKGDDSGSPPVGSPPIG